PWWLDEHLAFGTSKLQTVLSVADLMVSFGRLVSTDDGASDWKSSVSLRLVSNDAHHNTHWIKAKFGSQHREALVLVA
ncbi:MAG: hypothetical protein AAF850_04570, partial [Pseudomonadota bacterium]